MPDCHFEEYFLPDTPETTFGDETHWWARWSQPLRQANTVWWNPDWLYDVGLMSAHVYHCAKNSSGFPNTCWKSDTITRQMHAILVLFRPLPNVDIQNFRIWGMYNLAKAYGNIKNPVANRRVEAWEASNGHTCTKDKTRLFHGPWHTAVGEHICAQPFRMWNRLRFHTFLQVSQIFQRRNSDANKQYFFEIVKFDKSSSIRAQNKRDLNQGILPLWFKFGDPSLKGWWVIARTSSRWGKFWIWS